MNNIMALLADAIKALTIFQNIGVIFSGSFSIISFKSSDYFNFVSIFTSHYKKIKNPIIIHFIFSLSDRRG